MTYVDILFLRDTVQLTPGRQKLAASQILALLNVDEKKVFAAAANEAMGAADRAEKLSATRRLEAPKVYGDQARTEDTAADAAASLVFGMLESYARLHTANSDLGAAARRLLTAFFPHGLKAVVQARYAEELIQLERILADASAPELAAAVKSIPGLSAAMDALAERTRAYRVALDRQARVGVSYQEARSAADASERRLMELVAMILAHYRGDDEGKTKRRSELLEPYIVLMNDLRDRFRRRLPPGDIDSETGELVAGDVAAAIAAESGATSGV